MCFIYKKSSNKGFSLSVSLSLSLSLFVSLRLSLSLSISLCLSVSLSLCLCLSLCLSLSICVSLSLCVSLCLCFSLSFSLSFSFYLSGRKQSSTFKWLLETLLLAIKMCTGFTTDAKWLNTKVYRVTSEPTKSSSRWISPFKD